MTCNCNGACRNLGYCPHTNSISTPADTTRFWVGDAPFSPTVPPMPNPQPVPLGPWPRQPYPYEVTPEPQGWVCPVCGRGQAPHQVRCNCRHERSDLYGTSHSITLGNMKIDLDPQEIVSSALQGEDDDEDEAQESFADPDDPEALNQDGPLTYEALMDAMAALEARRFADEEDRELRKAYEEAQGPPWPYLPGETLLDDVLDLVERLETNEEIFESLADLNCCDQALVTDEDGNETLYIYFLGEYED